MNVIFKKQYNRLRPKSSEIVPLFFLYWMEWAFRMQMCTEWREPKPPLPPPPRKTGADEGSKTRTARAERNRSTLSSCDLKIAAIAREQSVLVELFRATLQEMMCGRLSAFPLIEEHQPQ